MQPVHDPQYLKRLNTEFNPKVQLPNHFLIRLNNLKEEIFKHCWQQFAAAKFDKAKLKALSYMQTAEYDSLGQQYNSFFGFHLAVLQMIEKEVELYAPLNSQLNECVPLMLCQTTIQEGIKVVKNETPTATAQRIIAIKNEVLKEFKYGERFLTAQSMPFICHFFRSLTPMERNYHKRTPPRSTKNCYEANLG